MSGWRAMLRLARREALRAPGRSLLVVVMIALPVLAVTAADVVKQTADVSGTEAISRHIGAADAGVWFTGSATVVQRFDPSAGEAGRGKATRPATLATISQVLARPVRGLERREGSVRVDTDRGVTRAEGTEVDLRSPLAAGLFRLTAGRLPRRPGEVVVNAALAARGPGLGDTVQVGDGNTATVVGIAESTTMRTTPDIAGPLGSLGLPDLPKQRTWLVDAGGPVSWQDVRALNRVGAIVASRAVIEDPPPASALPPSMRWSSSNRAAAAVAVLVVVMALLELVLLAGPAFAVGARRQQRTLALIAATGGTPRQVRHVVLASAVVVGTTAVAVGVTLGVAFGCAALPVVQRFSDSWLGPIDIPWKHLLAVAAFGVLSALLAALLPARTAARQDVVTVLAGRRGDRRPGLRLPLLGVVLVGAGIAGVGYGARVGSGGELDIAAATLVTVLGMILVIPVVLGLLGRLAHRLPLPVRYAVRDAARHRARTVPAVAAVAATVVGVVALGVGASSDELQNRMTYNPSLTLGSGVVTAWSGATLDWDAVAGAVRRYLPGHHVDVVRGVPQNGSTMLDVTLPGHHEPLLSSWQASAGAAVLVSRGSVPGALMHLDHEQRDAVRRVLADGGAVVPTTRPVAADHVQLSVERYARGKVSHTAPLTVPAYFLEVPGSMARFQAVVPPRLASALGLRPEVGGLTVVGPISDQAEADIAEAVAVQSPDASFYIERGYRSGDATRIALLVLGALGAVLMVGGTLTATFLGLADARPDLATLSAVGATPRMRRAVAAAYAGTVGLVGALLGAAVGFVPGLAVTYPLTGWTGYTVDAKGDPLPSHFVDVPWLLVVSIVVVLPALTALVVGVTARSRLPLVARIE